MCGSGLGIKPTASCTRDKFSILRSHPQTISVHFKNLCDCGVGDGVGSTCECRCSQGSQVDGIGSPEAGITGSPELLKGLLGSELRFLERAGHVLYHQATAPVPYLLLAAPKMMMCSYILVTRQT